MAATATLVAEAPPFAVWEADGFDAARLAAARARLAANGPPLPVFHRFASVSRVAKAWDKFYGRHDDRFFRERHYLERDFPVLKAGAHAPFALLELGCGTGASFLPLLPLLPHLTVTACDLSPHAIAHIRSHPAYASGRVAAFAHDVAAGGLALAVARVHADAGTPPAPLVSPAGFDAVLLLFVLSAMPPESHGPMLAEAARSLRPGGLVLVRDYGFLDEAQLRMGKGSQLDEEGRLCLRGDGTMAYYFEPHELAMAAAAAGFEVDWRTVDAGHAVGTSVAGGPLSAEAAVRDGGPCAVNLYRRYTNRAEGLELRRVWVHAVFRKPMQAVSWW
jgi:methyltransferase-like protein 6